MGIDIASSDTVAAFKASNELECAQSCQYVNECATYVYQPSQNMCRLKTNIRKPILNADAISGVKVKNGDEISNTFLGAD